MGFAAVAVPDRGGFSIVIEERDFFIEGEDGVAALGGVCGFEERALLGVGLARCFESVFLETVVRLVRDRAPG
ncbi:MAG: hypothetical protein ACJAQT_004281 [Akkermansiaceae bacterium]